MCQFTAPAFRLNSSHIPTPSPSTARLGSHPPSAGRPSSRHNLRKKKNFPVPVLRDWNGKLCGISDTGACPLSDIRRTTCGGRCPEHSSVWIASSFEMGARSGTRRSVCTAHCSHQISDVRDCLADSASFARCRRRSTGRFDHHLAPVDMRLWVNAPKKAKRHPKRRCEAQIRKASLSWSVSKSSPQPQRSMRDEINDHRQIGQLAGQ